MSELFNKEYYEQYDPKGGTINYEESDELKDFFKKVARHIIDDLHPVTVLDAGCAMGHFVAALRDCGVEAYGIDISEYAISRVRDDIRPYCAVGSLVDPLPKDFPERFDLITSIEVLEHLYAEDGKAAIENLGKSTDCIIFSSAPDNFDDPAHVNVQQREYWARLFASAGFYDDLNYRPTYLTYYAVCYRRRTDWLQQMEDYERNIRMTEAQYAVEIKEWSQKIQDRDRRIQERDRRIQERDRCIQERDRCIQERDRCIQERDRYIQERDHRIQEQDRCIQERDHRIQEQDRCIQERDRRIQERDRYIQERDHRIQEQDRCIQERDHRIQEQDRCIQERDHRIQERDRHYSQQLAEIQNAYNMISNSTFWKMTKPLRVVVDFVKRLLHSNRCTLLVYKGLKCLKNNGIRYTWRKAKDKLCHRQDYYTQAARPLYTQEELDAQRIYTFSRVIRFSILVPLYNTPENFLHEMIRSVLDQTYGDWELCMADGSDPEHAYVEQICREYAEKDKRVIYRRLESNKGISENTNACIDMAAGDYLALLDHDDVLHTSALFEVMKAICEEQADFIYTDEVKFEKDTTKCFAPNFKPDYAKDELRAHNYICHFTVYSRELLIQAGAYRSEYDGSQDHDIVLRMTECAKRIVHIPKILYFWRVHSGSVSAGVGTKQYAVAAAHNAVRAQLDRCGESGKVSSAPPYETIYKVDYDLKATPLVSVIIYGISEGDELTYCVKTLEDMSTYYPLELCVVKSSIDCDTFQDTLRRLPTVKPVTVVDRQEDIDDGFKLAVERCGGAYLVFLHAASVFSSSDWVKELLMFAQRDDVGAVGGKIYTSQNRILSAGIALDKKSSTLLHYMHQGELRDSPGYEAALSHVRNVTAMDGQYLMIAKEKLLKVGGLREGFAGYRFIDLCLRFRQIGLINVWTPFTEAVSWKDVSYSADAKAKFLEAWSGELEKPDPYYNPNAREFRIF